MISGIIKFAQILSNCVNVLQRFKYDGDFFLDTFKLTNTMLETKKPVMTAKHSTPFTATTDVKRFEFPKNSDEH